MKVISRRAFATGVAAAPLITVSSASAEASTANDEPPLQPQWHARVFDSHQLETVAVMADLIIPKTDTPGACDAKVHEYLDSLLADGPEDKRRSFLEGLWWVDGYCLRSFSHAFSQLPRDAQNDLLLRLSENVDPELQPGHAFFRNIKSHTTQIYYSTESGRQELNKGGRVPATYSCPR